MLLNCDLGEVPHESAEIYSLVDVANVACGGHAGDAATMFRASALARAHGAQIFAHPSYNDPEHFGRRRWAAPPEAMAASVATQVAALQTIATELGVPVSGIKAHGGLYHDLSEDQAYVEAFTKAVRHILSPEVVWIGAPGGELHQYCTRHSWPFLREGFVDRRYRDGTLVPRSEPHALVTRPQECAEQALEFVRSNRFDTLCFHGDTPGIVERVRFVHQALTAANLR